MSDEVSKNGYFNVKYLYFIALVLCLFIVFTNFVNVYFNTVYVILFMLLSLLLPLQFSLALFPVVSIYFGFSYISAHILITSFDNFAFINLFYISLAFRIIIKMNIQYFQKMP